MEKLYVQMYSFMEFMDGAGYDTKKNLKTAAEIGFAGVELFGPNFAIPPQEMKAYLKELNLEPISMHAPDTNSVEGLIPYAKALDMSFIGIGMDTFRDEEAAHAYARRLNKIGEKCHANGLRLTYHNHSHEFSVYGDKTVWDILIQETNPEYVSFELDAGWCAAGGANPMEIVEKYSGRIQLIHIKEMEKVIGSQPPMDDEEVKKDENGNAIFTEAQIASFKEKQRMNCAAGKGLVDWSTLKTVADKHGCKAYIVEREMTLHKTREETLKEDYIYYTTKC